MSRAIELAARCTPSPTAFSVGAVLVGADGVELSTGFSREAGPHTHAEEVALSKVPAADPRLAFATLYSTLEPCTERRSGPRPCAELIMLSGLRRVAIAWREPDLFVVGCVGVEQLTAAGIEVVELERFAAEARAVNAHLPLP